MDSGHCHSPPQPAVRPQKTEACNFTKTSGATGAVGVLTYDVIKRGSKSPTEKLAIMFSVPYDRNTYSNWVGVGFFKEDKECNEALYKEMYYDKKLTSFTRREADSCCLLYEGEELQVLCTMSPMGRSIMKVELWEKCSFAPSQYPY